jgi:uncharacterized membrane protein YeaQ/YmgE (transglycosylase-associated protein family)
MSLLLALIIGTTIGGLAGYLLPEDIDQIISSALVGICGSLLGTAFSLLLPDSNSLINIPGVLCATIGALIFVLLFNLVQRAIPKHAAHADTTEENPEDVKDIEERS